MSRASRMALVLLVAALTLAPAAALHPVVAHLYAAGLANLATELTHPSLLGFLVIAVVSTLPATGFTLVLLQAARGVPHFRRLIQGSTPAHLGGLDYRLIPAGEVLVFTAGLLRPVTFVSDGAKRVLGPSRLRAALLHEEAHRRGRDVAWRLLLRAIGRSFAFVPGVRDVIENETLRTECAADAYAICSGARRLDLFEAIVAASAPAGASLAAGLTDANLALRLERLANPDLPLPGRPARGLLVLAAVVVFPAIAAHLVAIAAVLGSSHMLA